MEKIRKLAAQSTAALQSLSIQGVNEFSDRFEGHAVNNDPVTQDFSTPGMKTYGLGDWSLQSGDILPGAFIAYKTYGDPLNPCILYPTWYSGLISDNEWLIGEEHVLSPTKYFIIVVALFGNGQSSSPSNTRLNPFPFVTFYDNVRAQHTLLTLHFDITRVKAVIGWSMGAGQAYQWATQFPDFMDYVIPFCGSAKTSLHNQVFLEGVKVALLGGKNVMSAGICKGGVNEKKVGGRGTWTPEQRERGLKALGRVYAGWGFSQAFYREKLYKSVLLFEDLENFMVEFWEKWALSKDPENMLTMLYTWQAGDCSNQEPYGGDFKTAMKAIKARTLVLPGKTDLYFPPEDSEIEVGLMNEGIGTVKAFPSIWGHWAGGPGDSLDDVKWLNAQLTELGL